MASGQTGAWGPGPGARGPLLKCCAWLSVSQKQDRKKLQGPKLLTQLGQITDNETQSQESTLSPLKSWAQKHGTPCTEHPQGVGRLPKPPVWPDPGHTPAYVHAKSLQLCLCDPVGLAHQVLLSRGFSRQEYWRGLPCPPPGGLPDPGTEPASLVSSALAGRFFSTSVTWEARTHLYLHPI